MEANIGCSPAKVLTFCLSNRHKSAYVVSFLPSLLVPYTELFKGLQGVHRRRPSVKKCNC